MDEQSKFYQNYLAATNPKRSTGTGQELTELQWKNGNVALQSSPPPAMENEMASLFQYPPCEYLEKEFGCDFLSEFSNQQTVITADKSSKSVNLCHNQNKSSPWKKMDSAGGGESSSMMTTESSICGSNQVRNRVISSTATGLMPRKFKKEVQSDHTFEVTGTSSSGGSGASIRATPQEMNFQSFKRKGIEMEESCSFSEEEGDYELADGKKSAQRSRRTRAAEVHNLSERKRRDRINEKMKALQDLIPHCTKSDKASMLDEAIEYLKSLQQQVQLLWMGSGMATMMFPGIQNFMAQMSVGIGRGAMPALNNLAQMPTFPLVNQQPIPSLLSANQIPMFAQQSVPPHLGFNHIQPSPQGMNSYAYGAQLAQQNQMAGRNNRSGDLPADVLLPPDNLQ